MSSVSWNFKSFLKKLLQKFINKIEKKNQSNFFVNFKKNPTELYLASKVSDKVIGTLNFRYKVLKLRLPCIHN